MKSTGGLFRRIVAAQTIALCALANSPSEALAQAEYAEKIKLYDTVQPKGGAPFGEDINMLTGELSFLHTDIELIGRGPPIVLARGYEYSSIETLGGWSLTIPRIEVLVNATGRYVLGEPGTNWKVDKWLPDGSIVGTTARCTEFNLPFDPEDDLWIWWAGGYEFTTDRGEKQQLLKRMPAFTATAGLTAPNGTPYVFPIVTQQNWQIGCLPNTSNGQAGEGFLAVSPDGTKYYLDYLVGIRAPDVVEAADGGERPIFHSRMAATMFVSRIVDRFGNAVNYNYSGDKLTSIVADDGRNVAITWATDGTHRIVAIKTQPATPDERVWQYGYSSGRLSSVTLPDQSSWSFTLPNTWKPAALTTPTCSTRTSPSVVGPETLHTVTTPSGLTGTFKLSGTRHGRSYVPSECVSTGYSQYESSFPIYGTASLIQKSMTGPGVNQVWNYTYAPVAASTTHDACAQNGTCADTTWVDISAPNGDRTRHTISTRFGAHEGKTVKVETFAGVTLQRTDTFSYAAPDQGPYPARFGSALDTQDINARVGSWAPLASAVTTQDGVAFSSSVENFDHFARPTKVAKASTLGHSRKEVTTYSDNQALWVVGQLATTRCVESLAPCEGAGYTLSKTEYDSASALPVRIYGPGEKLKTTFTYNADGTVATRKDGNNNVITLSNWKRGIPQSIKHPITAESPTGALQSAIVNNNGWITSTTDENGYSTNYGYDAMGRLSSIVFPGDDSTVWNSVAQSFQQINSTEHGLAAGHWRRSQYQGNKHVNTYYDAMWRPVLEEKLDHANIGGTLSQTVKRYDTNGRLAFESYPTTNVSDFNSITQGVRTTYDALDRVTRVEQDSELGILPTTYQYASGFQQVVTNPRGFQTVTQYQVFDSPTTSAPTGITSLASADTSAVEIYRDVFGNPTRISKRNGDGSLRVDRFYVYDAYMQLCKRIDPETGATVMGYDGVGNLTHSWSGLALPATNSCNGDEAWQSGRLTWRRYTARNQMDALRFADGRGDQNITYTPDGLLDMMTTWNGLGGDGPVVNTYTYNKRRLLVGEAVQQTGWYTWGLGYGYDGNGSLSTQTYPTGMVINYAPNALGQATQAGSYAVGAQYYPNGAIKQFTYGNGLTHNMTQNARQLPDRVTDSGNALDHQYVYDANANPTGIYDYIIGAPTAQHRYLGYDGLDRLVAAGSAMFGGSDHYHRFTYDALDNLKSWKHAGIKDYAQYVYGANNQLTNIKNTAGATVVGLSYDVQGNLANKNGKIYDFDYGNRLKKTDEEWYRYDGQGRRVLNWRLIEQQGVLSQYSQSGQLMYDENYRASGRKSSTYIYLAGSLVATNEWNFDVGTGATKYQHTDALGSPVAVTNSAGTVIDRTNWEPFGAAINKPAYDGVGYTGHVMDGATGLTYMQQRYYDPVIGSFLSTDPVDADANAGANFNRYWYGNDNPYRFTDPDGRITKEMIKQGFEEIGDGLVVRVDQFKGTGGEASFEVHVYKDSKALEKAVASGDYKGVRAAEINTLTSTGDWGKHGKPAQPPNLGKKAQAGFDKVVQRELQARGWVEKNARGRLQLRDNIRRNLGKYSRYMGAAGAALEYTRSSMDRACEIHPSDEEC